MNREFLDKVVEAGPPHPGFTVIFDLRGISLTINSRLSVAPLRSMNFVGLFVLEVPAEEPVCYPNLPGI